MHSHIKKTSLLVGITLTLLGRSLCSADEPSTGQNAFSFNGMNQDERQKTGIHKLAPEEQTALEQWMKLSVQIAQNDEALDEVPVQENPPEVVPSDEGAGGSLIVALDAAQTQQEKGMGRLFAITETREDGKFVVLENGVVYKVPTMLRRKSASWKKGDVLTVDATKKTGWFRLRNTRTNEHVLAQIE